MGEGLLDHCPAVIQMSASELGLRILSFFSTHLHCGVN